MGREFVPKAPLLYPFQVVKKRMHWEQIGQHC